MSKGFLSCIGYEYKGSIHQYLNIVDPNAVDALLLATTLMRNVHSEFTNDYSLSTGVGSIELEVRFENNIMKIPRIMNATSLNTRYAAGHRVVFRDVALKQSAVQVRAIEGNFDFVEVGTDSTKSLSEMKSVQIQVRYSLALALKVEGAGFLSVVLGTDETSSARVIALSDKNASRVSVPAVWSWEVPANIAENQEAQYLKTVASTLLARHLVQQADTNTGILVHGASDLLEHAISTQALAKGKPP